MAKPLLPGLRPGTQIPTGFGAGNDQTGLIPITPDEALRDLIWKPGLKAEGVSHALAVAEVFKWRLELGGGDEPETRRILELLLQSQFLGLPGIRRISLGAERPSTLKGVVREFSGQDGLTVWTMDVGGTNQIVAGGLGVRYPLFASAWLQEESSRIVELSNAIEAASSGALKTVDNRLVFTNLETGRRFRRSLSTLLLSTREVSEPSPWRTAIGDLAQHEPAGPEFPAHPGLIPPDVAREQWVCIPHKNDSKSWIEECRGRAVTLTASHPILRCPIHAEPLRDVTGDPVNIEVLGAVVVARTSAGQHLYIWADEPLPPHLVRVETGDRSVTLAYWDPTGPRVRMDGTVIRLKDVLSRCVAIPLSLPHGAEASLGVKPEYLELVDRIEWNRAQMQWKVKFRGRAEVVALDPPENRQSEPQDGVVVWPKQLPNPGTWQKDIAAVFFGRSCDEAAPVVRRHTGALEEMLYVEKPWIADVEGRVEFIALRKDRVPVGVIPIVRDPSNILPRRVGYVAIDFGTSNTSVLHIAEGDQQAQYTPQGQVDPSEYAHLATAGTGFIESLKNSLVLYSAWYRNDQPAGPDRLFGTLLLDRSLAGRGSSILPRRSGLLRNFRPAPNSTLHEDLKWQDPKAADRNALERYLERALLRAFYELASSGCARVKVAATFPLAFDNPRKQFYESALHKALQNLSEASGLSFDREQLQVFSESAAGISGTPALGAHYSLTIDLGGGTTDLAVLDSDKKVVAVDSLKVGARGLLKVILAQEEAAITQLGLADLQVSPVLAIEAAVQENPAKVRSALSPALNAAQVRQALAATFAAVIVASARLLRAAIPEPSDHSVNVVLLGQGWQLMKQGILGPYNEDWFFATLKQHVSGTCQVSLANAPSDPQERKLALVRGALSLLRNQIDTEQRFHDPPFVIGMELQAEGRAPWPARTLVGEVGKLGKIIGDGGYSAVVDDLWKVMTLMSRKGYELGLEEAQLKNIREQLCPQGVHLLTGELSPGGKLSGSPLMRFLDQCWQPFWAGHGAYGR